MTAALDLNMSMRRSVNVPFRPARMASDGISIQCSACPVLKVNVRAASRLRLCRAAAQQDSTQSRCIHRRAVQAGWRFATLAASASLLRRSKQPRCFATHCSMHEAITTASWFSFRMHDASLDPFAAAQKILGILLASNQAATAAEWPSLTGHRLTVEFF